MSVMFHYLGLLLVLLTWACGAYLVQRWRSRDHVTLSRHGASTTKSYLLFAGTVAGLGSLFFIWALRVIAPRAIPAFAVILTASFLLQLGAAIVPDRPGRQRAVHQYFAWVMAVSWIPLSLAAALSVNLSTFSRILSALAAIYMLVLFGVFLSGNGRRRFLLLQSSYIIVAQLALLAAAYL